MPTPLSVPPLVGRNVRLEPLGEPHIADLGRAVGDNHDTFTYYPAPHNESEARGAVEHLLALFERGEWVPFAQIRQADDRVMGVTCYLNLRRRHEGDTPYAVEIGGTWISPAVQRTGFNSEAKYLLLRYAFEELGVGRVDIKSDERNIRSRTAIERIGATFEGVLRHWQPSYVAGEETKLRNTAMYAIIDSQWPAVRDGLLAKMQGESA